MTIRAVHHSSRPKNLGTPGLQDAEPGLQGARREGAVEAGHDSLPEGGRHEVPFPQPGQLMPHVQWEVWKLEGRSGCQDFPVPGRFGLPAAGKTRASADTSATLSIETRRRKLAVDQTIPCGIAFYETSVFPTGGHRICDAAETARPKARVCCAGQLASSLADGQPGKLYLAATALRRPATNGCEI